MLPRNMFCLVFAILASATSAADWTQWSGNDRQGNWDESGILDQFPEGGRVGEAVAKMADHYYQQKDYSRAIDTFETVLDSHPDARFLDVILFNYGRCLFRMERQGPARQRFEQLIADFPESQLAPDAKKIAEALKGAGF